MRDLTNFIAHPNETLSDVFKKMEKNEHGIIFVCEDSGMFIGVATDGDIRRSLLATRDMDMPIVNCVNRDCVTASSQDSREYVLKLLDHRVHVVPILDSDSRIVDFASNRFFPLAPERAVVVRSAAPVRISFGGGGTDLTHFFVSNEMGAVLSATIRRYSYCTLIKRSDRKIVIRSSDIDAKIETDNLGELQKDDRFSLIGAVLELIQPCFGFELDIRSEFEVGSG
ncbi:MAG: CBS domain-containing protein, partial [Bdellovibrionales bacterium]|nr:CBS domain-containing protein [Bdellovibrionales bacterium]